MKLLAGRATVVALPGDAHLGIFGGDLLVVFVFPYCSQDEWEDEDEDQESAKHRAHDGAGNAAVREMPGHDVASGS